MMKPGRTLLLFTRPRALAAGLAASLAVSLAPDAGAQIPHRCLLVDEGNANLHLMESGGSEPAWTVPLDGNGRDLQLIGNNRVLVSAAAGGYFEIDLAQGARMKQIKTFGAVQSARRLPNGHTLLAGDNLQGSQGITILDLDAQDKLVRKTVFPGLGTLRILRLTPKGDFLFGSGESVIEGDASGKILWEAKLPGAVVYKALRLPDGDTWVSTGYAKTLVLLSPAKAVRKTIPSSALPAEVNAHFFGDFQILSNGHLVVTNWQNHGPGHGNEGMQLLEFDSTGALVSGFRQDPARFSSLHSVLVLDDLDATRLHDESSGLQAPFQTTSLGRESGLRGLGGDPFRHPSRSSGPLKGSGMDMGWVLGRSG